MTRDEFIDGYMERSKIEPAKRTSHGMNLDGYRLTAMPCACGESDCEGWAMISDEQAHHHLFFNAPDPLRSLYIHAVGRPIVTFSPRRH